MSDPDAPRLPPPPPPPALGVERDELNTKAVVAFVLAAVCWPFGCVPAIVLGSRSIREIAASNGRQSGRGLARVAVVLGWLGVVGCVLALPVLVVLLREFATADAR